MDLIDDKGRLFGTVNIIDALAVLLVLAVVAAGTTFVLGAEEGHTQNTTTTTTVTVQATDLQPYVADAIPEGQVDTERIDAVQSKSVQPTQVVVKDQNGELHERTHPQNKTVTLELTLNTTETDEDTLFDGEPLEVGRKLTLDFGPATVKGTVTELPTEN